LYLAATSAASYDNPNFKSLTSLPDQASYSFRDLTLQNFVAVFGCPDKMVFNLVNRMIVLSVFHKLPPYGLLSQLKLTG
jgi:hypothetical protein